MFDLNNNHYDHIINLTKDAATSAQLADGVFEPSDKPAVQDLLTFVGKPVLDEIDRRACELARIAKASGAKAAMIGGPSFLMSALERYLRTTGVRPGYAYTQRKSVKRVLPDRTLATTDVFSHEGFIWL